MIGRASRNILKRSLNAAFRLGQRVGIDLLPRHFYSAIPDVSALLRSKDWRKPMEMFGVPGADIASQLEFARACCSPELSERTRAADLYQHAANENGQAGYGQAEGDFLYCFVGSKKPRRIVQVGAGFSTAILLKAAGDFGLSIDITCVDPFPTEYLRRLNSEGKIRLVNQPAQTVDRALLTDVGADGMLFVDSTHTVKVGSEVNRLILDVLPRLPMGAWVHFHDIYFPYDYPRDILSSLFFSSETTLLHAFLLLNSRFTLRCALSMLHYERPADLQRLLPRYQPLPNDDGLTVPGTAGHFPSATYLQVVT